MFVLPKHSSSSYKTLLSYQLIVANISFLLASEATLAETQKKQRYEPVQRRRKAEERRSQRHPIENYLLFSILIAWIPEGIFAWLE